MACNLPLPAAQLPGGRVRVFPRGAARVGLPDGTRMFEVPCGVCMGCRIDNARSWAVRCVHEAQMHDAGSFVTLTYADEHLPNDGSLDPGHLRDFMKRLRYEIQPRKIRFFACGEYGPKFQRPHYHLLIFGEDFSDDREQVAERKGNPIYRSPTLEKCWKFGFSSIGAISTKTAFYTALYVTKKFRGDDEEVRRHYEVCDPDTGELHTVFPEFLRASNRPGLGESWLHVYREELLKGFVTIDGKPFSIPRYYMKVLERDYPDLYLKVLAKREEAGKRFAKQWHEGERRERHMQVVINNRQQRSFENGA